MIRKTHGILAVSLMLATAALVAGCEQTVGATPADQVEPVELETYVVPAEYREELRNMLRAALGTDEDRLGRVTGGPGGTLLVVAPPRIQEGVKEILSKGFDAPPVASPVQLTYWLVVGRSVESRPGRPDASFVGKRRPEVLEPVLAELVSVQGPTEFAILEQVRLTSVSQAEARTKSDVVRVSQRATRTGDHVVADVRIELEGNSFNSQVMLGKGQFLVLGQSGFGGKRGQAFPDAADDDSLTLFYVMAADLDS